MKKTTLSNLTAKMVKRIDMLRRVGYGVKWVYDHDGKMYALDATTCVIYKKDDVDVYWTGVTRKHKKDAENLKLARHVSFMRAYKNMLKAEKMIPAGTVTGCISCTQPNISEIPKSNGG